MMLESGAGLTAAAAPRWRSSERTPLKITDGSETLASAPERVRRKKHSFFRCYRNKSQLLVKIKRKIK